MRLFCEGSVGHFEWLCALGVAFKDTFVAEKTGRVTDLTGFLCDELGLEQVREAALVV